VISISTDELAAIFDNLPPEDRTTLGDNWGRGLFRRIVTATAKVIDAEYRLSDDRHLVNVDDDGWTVQHPMSCRPNLFACQWSDTALIHWGGVFDRLSGHPHEPGIYNGSTIPDPASPTAVRLVLGERVEESGDGA
jgi:hypothetical protein